MFITKLNIMLFYITTLFFGVQQIQSCFTPLMAFAKKMNIIECTPIMELLNKYGINMPPVESKFIRESFLNVEDRIVCCDLKMNITETFDHLGVALLRNYAKHCGDNTAKRISFGIEAPFMTYPWSALLVYDATERFQCGATLITNQYVITAAHCINQTYPLIGVRLRENNISTEVDCTIDFGGFQHCSAPVIDIGIEKTIVHPNYSSITYNNDIALIRLKRAIRFERTVRPICLPEYQNQEFQKSVGTVTGWGITENGTQSDVLLEADIPIYNISHCQQIYRRHVFDETKICAGGENSVDVCKGDSGGPLFLRMEGYNSKFRYIQMGVTSLGVRKCGDNRNYPAVFTKVSSYMDWIASNIQYY